MKNKPTKQHYVPQCYLREFEAHPLFKRKDSFVWIFDRKGKDRRKDKIRNVLASNDLYTLKIDREKNYVIEETLGNLECRYAEVYRSKIKNRLPLSLEDHAYLCAFVSVMLQRTLRYKDNLEHFFDELIEKTKIMEDYHNAKHITSKELEQTKIDIHKLNIIESLPDITKLLLKMKLAFLCAEKRSYFITSDDPCNLFNPKLQGQHWGGPGLAQKDVELTMSLSPQILLLMSWSNYRGYVKCDKKAVEELNRLIVGHCYKYFVSHKPKTKWIWFHKYPLNIPFILKVIVRKIKMKLRHIYFNYKYDR